MLNPYEPMGVVVENVITETPNIKTLVLKPDGTFQFQTGQFVELTVPGLGEAPFTPSSSPQVKGKFDLTIMKAGHVTSILHQTEPGEFLAVRGPYGHGYPIEKFKGKEVLVVGGGVGLPPLRSLLYTLFTEMDSYKRVLLRYGARTPVDLVYKDELKRWSQMDGNMDVVITVDRGDETWKGNVGVVTTILDGLNVDLSNSVAIVCGPPIMEKFVTFKLLSIGYRPEDIYLSMERNMSCGFGKCGHCRLGKFYVCKDGPVFNYGDIQNIPDIWA